MTAAYKQSIVLSCGIQIFVLFSSKYHLHTTALIWIIDSRILLFLFSTDEYWQAQQTSRLPYHITFSYRYLFSLYNQTLLLETNARCEPSWSSQTRKTSSYNTNSPAFDKFSPSYLSLSYFLNKIYLYFVWTCQIFPILLRR